MASNTYAPGNDPSDEHPPDGVTNAHVNCDVDDGTEAFHHTLGEDANQAAAGNHLHFNKGSGIQRPAASKLTEGLFFTIIAGTGVASITYVCLQSATNTYSWKVVATG